MCCHVKYVSIADIKIKIMSDLKFEISERCKPFQIENFSNEDVCIELKKMEECNFDNFIKVSESENTDEFKNQNKIIRVNYSDDKKEIIKWYSSKDGLNSREFTIFIAEKYISDLKAMNPLFYFELSHFFIQYDAIILHSSLINFNNNGIAFSAPSGIGKSTQAQLWSDYRNAKILNGDRSIIRLKHNNEYVAYGSPYAGSSQIYVNEGVSLKAIVILKQAPDNRIRRAGIKEAYLHILSQVSISSWNRDVVSMQSDFIFELINKVPVYILECLPDKNAVEMLYKELEDKFIGTK